MQRYNSSSCRYSPKLGDKQRIWLKSQKMNKMLISSGIQEAGGDHLSNTSSFPGRVLWKVVCF